MKDKSTSDIGSASFIVANSAAANQAIVYVGVTAALQVTLNNQTGGNIGVQSDSSLEIYMPSYFTTAEVQAMSITNISQSGWTAFYNSEDVSWMLTYTGSETWANNSTLTFTIANVLCNATSSTDTVQVNFNDLTGSSVPAQVSASLALTDPVVPTKINLDTVLSVQAEFGGMVYVSLSSDPLTNTVYLNLANTGATPLYNGNAMWQGTPCVYVSFVYGNTSGSLAPDDKRQAGEQGSAWSISGAVSVDQTAGWSIENPTASGQSNSPVWKLSPVGTNKQIIGTGSEANVSFAFSNIFSFTPPGATLMYVQFTGFTRDENTVYNPEIFTLSLYKQSAPYNRGLLKFYGPPILYAMGIQKIPVPLFWSGYEIASVQLICNSVPPPTAYSNTYLDTTPLIYDQTISTVPSAGPGAELLFTMQSFDNDGNILNSPQFTVSVEQQAAVYTFNGPAQATAFAYNTPVTITLDWKIYNVASIKISSASSADFTNSYTGGPVWTTDSASIAVNGLTAALPIVTFTLYAYDENGKLLNSIQCTADFTLNSFTDPRDQTVYPVVVINGTAWMAQNSDYNDPASHFYQDNQGYEDITGRYYLFASAQQDAPPGWRLSTNEDWKVLINSYGSGTAAYNALMNNGSAGFNAGSYGYLSIDNTWLLIDGLYWAVDDGGNSYGVMFSSYGIPVASVLDSSSFYGPIVACNVRYVLNAPAADETETVQSQTSQHKF